MPDMILARTAVEVTADLSGLDRGLDQARDMTERKLQAAEAAAKRISSQMLLNRLKFKTLDPNADGPEIANLTVQQRGLEKQYNAVSLAAGKQAGALGASGRAANGMAASTARATQGMAQMQGGSRSSAMGLLLLSQAVEDAQFGINAVVNNVPGIVMAFGGTAGMAGAASIAAVAVNQLVKHWDELKDSFGDDSFITKAMKGLEGLGETAQKAAKWYADLAVAGKDLSEIHGGEEAEAARRADMRAQRESGAQVAKIADRSAEERGRGVAEAVGKAGGGAEVQKQLLDVLYRERDAHPTDQTALHAERRQQAQDALKATFGGAGRGNQSDINYLKELAGKAGNARLAKELGGIKTSDQEDAEKEKEKADERRKKAHEQELAEFKKREEFSRTQAKKHNDDIDRRESEKAQRIAGTFEKSPEFLRGKSRDDVGEMVRKALPEGTSDESAGRVADKVYKTLRDDFEKRLEEVATEGGTDRAGAMKVLARQAGLGDAQEALKQSQAEAGVSQAEKALRQAQFGTASFQGTEQMLKNIQLGAFDDPEKENLQVLKDHLKVAEATRDLLKDKKEGPARAG